MGVLLLDFGSAVLLLLVLLATGDIYLATGAGLAAAVGSLAWTWIRRRRVEAVQALGQSIVLVMGGATILLHDPRFVMFKPTLVDGWLGATMCRPGWMFRYLPSVAADAPRPVIVALGWIYAGTMFVLAAANAAVVSLASPKAWATFNGTVPWIAFTALGLVNWRVVRSAVISVRRSRAQEA